MHLHLQLIVKLVQTAFYNQPSNGHSHHRWLEAKFDPFFYLLQNSVNLITCTLLSQILSSFYDNERVTLLGY